MQNMLLATAVLSDQATLKGTTAAGDLSLSNLKTKSLKQVYRAPDASSVYIVSDLGSAAKVDLVALIGHCGSSRSYVRVRGAAVEADLTTSPDFDSGDLPFRSHQTGYNSTWAAGVEDEEQGALDKNMFVHFFEEQELRFWRFDISDPNGTYLDIGRLYIAKAWQPDTNMEYGVTLGHIDPSRDIRTRSGDFVSVDLEMYRYTDFRIGFASETEMFDGAFEIERMVGKHKDVLFIYDPDVNVNLQKRSMYGVMRALQPIINSTYSIYEKTFRIEEIPS